MENRKWIKYMQAFSEGVVYYSNSGTKACSTILKKDGQILNELYLSSEPHFPKTFLPENEYEKNFSYFLVLFFDALLIFFSAITKSTALLVATTLFSLNISLNLFKLLNIILEFKFGSATSTAKYVAASHMATNAYRDLQKVPTLEEVKKYSMYSADCRIIWTFISVFSKTATCITILCLMTNVNIFTIFLAISISITLNILIVFLFTSGIMNFLQFFITSKPTDKELEVAIAGLEAYEDMENIALVRIEEE